MCRVPTSPQDTCMSGVGPRETRLCCPFPFTGHSAARGWSSGRLGQGGPHAVSSQGPQPLQACRHQCPNAFLAQPVAPIRAVLRSAALAPSHLPHPLSQLQVPHAPLPQPRPPSQPALLSSLFSHLLQAMAVAIALVLSLLAIQHGLKHSDQTEVATAKRMQQREEYLHQEMTRLLREIEQSRGTEEATLRSVLQHRLFQTIVGIASLLAAFRWLTMEIALAVNRYSQEDGSSGDEDDVQEEEALDGAHAVVRPLAVSTPWAAQGLPDTCQVLKELMGDLLGVCQVLGKKTFMPQMQPAIGMDDTYEAWSVHENSIAYHLLVFLQPPPGHRFSLELHTTGQLPARHSSIRVALECICSREQLLGDPLCFLHHADDTLQRDQISCLLRTLCTGSCLDVEKIACWVQALVRSAWLLLPQSHHCQLMVLPSSQSCKFQLTSASKINIFAEMTFAVQQGTSGAYLRLK